VQRRIGIDDAAAFIEQKNRLRRAGEQGGDVDFAPPLVHASLALRVISLPL
jgi:hypothetical protein